MNFQRPPKKTVLYVLLIVVITLVFSSMLSIWLMKVYDLNVPSMGIVKTIGLSAYWDENLENETEIVNWDIIRLGSSKNVSFYLRSLSNVKTSLQFNATNWYPNNMSKYMNFSWNYNGTLIDPGEVIQVTITISAPSSMSFFEYMIANEVKEFSFDIVISAIE